MKIAVIGDDSSLGKCLKKDLQNASIETVGFSRRVKKKSLHLDLNNIDYGLLRSVKDIDAVFVSAAITSQRLCNENPGEAWKVNVENTIKLLEYFNLSGVHVLFPSTNLVLGGEISFANPLCEPAPIGFYARMKAEVERFLLKKDRASIIRITKVLESDRGIVPIWTDALKNGGYVDIITNVQISPISVRFSSLAIMKILKSRRCGIWQLSGEKDISYLKLYELISQRYEYKNNPPQQNAVRLNQADQCVPFGTLDTYRIVEEFGVQPQSIQAVLDDVLD